MTESEQKPTEPLITEETKDNLKKFLARLDTIEGRKDSVKELNAAIKDDEKQIYAEAKAYGIDSTQLKNLMKFRLQNQEKAKGDLAMFLGMLEAIGIVIL